jgi:hypothetical protein
MESQTYCLCNNIEKSLNSAEKRTMKALCNIKEKESNEDAI